MRPWPRLFKRQMRRAMRPPAPAWCGNCRSYLEKGVVAAVTTSGSPACRRVTEFERRAALRWGTKGDHGSL